MKNFIGSCFNNIELLDVFTVPNIQETLVIWRCKQCGDAGIRTFQDLNNTLDKICFCNNSYRQQEYVKYIGKTFNELTILDVINFKDVNKNSIAMALCSCGALCRIFLSNITKNHTKSCGHLKKDYINQQKNHNELIGKKFNRLTIMDIYFDENKKRQMAICQCDCGRVKTIRLDGVTSGHATSCGCYSKEKTAEIRKGIRKLNTYTVLDNGIISVLTSSGHRFLVDDISWKYLKNLTWSLSGNGYVMTRSIEKIPLLMHILLIDCPIENGFVRDHIDRNPTNNTYQNLRVISCRDNVLNCNRSFLFKDDISGIKWKEQSHKWEVSITPDVNTTNRKLFTTLSEAIDWKKEQLNLYYNIIEIPTERLFLPSGDINGNYPFYKFPDTVWKELGIFN